MTENKTKGKIDFITVISYNRIRMKNENKAMFGAGCFWCVEDDFRKAPGVTDVTSGYSGGAPENPTYEQVCTGTTGHAEVVLVAFNPDLVTYKVLVETFFKVHDPTTLNRQGPDVGTQYRSVIYYFNDPQLETANQVIETLTRTNRFLKPIMTEVAPAQKFYRAEEYHQDYYCKLRTKHADL